MSANAVIALSIDETLAHETLRGAHDDVRHILGLEADFEHQRTKQASDDCSRTLKVSVATVTLVVVGIWVYLGTLAWRLQERLAIQSFLSHKNPHLIQTKNMGSSPSAAYRSLQPVPHSDEPIMKRVTFDINNELLHRLTHEPQKHLLSPLIMGIGIVTQLTPVLQLKTGLHLDPPTTASTFEFGLEWAGEPRWTETVEPGGDAFACIKYQPSGKKFGYVPVCILALVPGRETKTVSCYTEVSFTIKTSIHLPHLAKPANPLIGALETLETKTMSMPVQPSVTLSFYSVRLRTVPGPKCYNARPRRRRHPDLPQHLPGQLHESELATTTTQTSTMSGFSGWGGAGGLNGLSGLNSSGLGPASRESDIQ